MAEVRGALFAPEQRRFGRRRVTLAGLATALTVVVASALWPTAAVSAQGADDAVDVQVEVGDRGVVGGGAAMPVRVTMTSDRARNVEVGVEWDEGYRSYRTELPAGAATVLDLSLPAPSDGADALRVDVTDGSDRVGDGQVQVAVTGETALVGIGSSLASAGAPESSSTVGAVQEARLVELTAESWVRPGWLESMSTVVLGAQDVDRLEDEQRSQLRTWVWRGGELIVDTAPAEVLPVVDLPSAPGPRTAVGSGWVRFGDGRAALGEWSSLLEPAVLRTTMTPSAGLWMGDELGGGLVEIEFLSVWVIVLAVFGSALVAGPGLWFVLRTRRRRRLMWIAAPGVSLLVAAGLLVLGQGVFTRSEMNAASSLVADPWHGSGSVSMGVREPEVLELPAGAELTSSTPVAVVTDTGTRSVARIDVGRNSFGALSVSPVDLEHGPDIAVTATVGDAGTVDVTVRNDSDDSLTGVVVQGAGRAQVIDDVPARGSVTVPFEVLENIVPFAAMFDASLVPPEPGGMGGGEFVGGPMFAGPLVGLGTSLPLSRGLVVVTGTMQSEITALGRTLPGRSEVTAIAPIVSAGPSTASLRIDAVGPLPPGQEVNELFPEEQAPMLSEEPAGTERFRQYVRFTAAAGRAASPCALHTVAEDLQFWDGASWVPAAKVGAPHGSPRIANHEVQDWAFPDIPAGGTLLASVSMGLAVQTPLLFDCVGP